MMQIWRPSTPPPEELGTSSSSPYVGVLISRENGTKTGVGHISCGCCYRFFFLSCFSVSRRFSFSFLLRLHGYTTTGDKKRDWATNGPKGAQVVFFVCM